MFTPHDSPFYTGAPALSVRDNPEFRELFDAWLDIVPHCTVWEYGVDYANWFRIVPTMPLVTESYV